MSELRQRQTVTSRSNHNSESPAQTRPSRQPENDHGISVLDIIRVLATLVLLSCGISYYMTNTESLLWGYRPWFTRWPVVKSYLSGPLTLTPAQLSLYNGTDESLPIYLAVNGSVFDVSANPAMYGAGGSYNFFAGRDATRAFVTGCFQEDLTPDLGGVEEMFLPVEDVQEGLSAAQVKVRREREMRLARTQIHKTVARWEGFFRNHKRYFQVGRVVDGESADPEWGRRGLCEGAQSQRPKRSEMDAAA
ncbi:hypothetical protein N7492_007436 [Penicillium capsulatum]|uniref:Cytochrome b5 heme-binding domain-containing protein n=1 Tax=Penicillium capsulatum TaxID=69766 RepID=A0A9W9HZT8_9EURO|nr:hypothetical protein N7492_007436 [Penicillium capsulatum]KAJ6117271.1 hypothetical protein N7512_006996 [Penicillium capsulatum]